MSLYLGETPICGGIEGNQLSNPFSLLDYKFSEYEISNASWLRSNGQYNSGTTYADVYNLLLQIYNGTVTKAGVSVKLSTETYEDTDFVLNTTDTTFRLPLKVALASGKMIVGNGINLGITSNNSNIAGLSWDNSIGLTLGQSISLPNNAGASGVSITSGYGLGITTDPTKSGIETSANGLYLYFYVGAVIQDASVIAAASVLTQIAELLSCDYVVESKVATAEDPTWYRVYKSGWVEQGGYFSDTSNGAWAVTLLKPYTTSNYYISGIADNHTGIAGSFVMIDQNTQTTTGFTILVNYTGTVPSTKTLRWEAKGQGA